MNAFPMVARCAERQPIFFAVRCWICGEPKLNVMMGQQESCSLCAIRKALAP